MPKAVRGQRPPSGFAGDRSKLYQQILRPLLVQTFDRSPDLIDAAMRNYVMSFESSGVDTGTHELIERLRPILAAPIADHLGATEDCWTEERLPMMAAFARIFQRYHVEDSEPVPAVANSYPPRVRLLRLAGVNSRTASGKAA